VQTHFKEIMKDVAVDTRLYQVALHFSLPKTE